jgi:hypothetical protein
MKKALFLSILVLVVSGCGGAMSTDGQSNVAPDIGVTSSLPPKANLQPTGTPQPTPTPVMMTSTYASGEYGIPDFDHIILIVLENQYLQNVIGNSRLTNINALARNNVLLGNYSPVAHPSLPNYLALVSGSTQNITTDCSDCFVNQPNLADEIEASGRTWKAYLEDMPSPCFVGNQKPYVQMFDPFIYFDSIRLNPERCDRSIVPLTRLDEDLTADQLPNFVYIAPNLCNSGHDCPPETADAWVGNIVAELEASPALGKNSLIIITYDEGVEQTTLTKTRGEVTTILISPLARPGFVDKTRYTHYSLLKTILRAWNLPDLGQTGLAGTNVIQEPWINQVGQIYPYELTLTP